MTLERQHAAHSPTAAGMGLRPASGPGVVDEVEAKPTLTTVVKAIRVMQSFSSNERVLGVSELARRLDMSKSTVHRLLTTLVEQGLVHRTGDNRYRLGLRLYQLGQLMVTGLDVWDVAYLPLDRLRTHSGETASLAVLDVPDVVDLERFESPGTLRLFSRLGRRSPAHATSSGKCLLAFGAIDDVARVIAAGLPRVAPRTITTPGLLADALTEIRDRGYSVSVEESFKDLVSVGAPVFGPTGTCTAAVSVAGPITRMPPDNLDHLADLVTATAAEVSRSLGHRTPAPGQRASPPAPCPSRTDGPGRLWPAVERWVPEQSPGKALARPGDLHDQDLATPRFE